MSCNWPRCICKATGNYCSDRPQSGPKKKKPIPKVNKNRQRKADIKKLLFPNDAAFYLEIWQEREHIDFEDGTPIHGQLLTLYFHHVLEKQDYPEYRYCKWNIVLLTWQHHDQVNLNIDKVPKVKQYTEKLLQLHEQGILKDKDPNTHFL